VTLRENDQVDGTLTGRHRVPLATQDAVRGRRGYGRFKEQGCHNFRQPERIGHNTSKTAVIVVDLPSVVRLPSQPKQLRTPGLVVDVAYEQTQPQPPHGPTVKVTFSLGLLVTAGRIAVGSPIAPAERHALTTSQAWALPLRARPPSLGADMVLEIKSCPAARRHVADPWQLPGSVYVPLCARLKASCPQTSLHEIASTSQPTIFLACCHTQPCSVRIGRWRSLHGS